MAGAPEQAAGVPWQAGMHPEMMMQVRGRQGRSARCRGAAAAPAAWSRPPAAPALAARARHPTTLHPMPAGPQGMAAMPGVPMQMVMGPMGPMVAPMGAMPPGAMAAPQLTQMLVDAARGGRSSNVFFKTRICNK